MIFFHHFPSAHHQFGQRSTKFDEPWELRTRPYQRGPFRQAGTARRVAEQAPPWSKFYAMRFTPCETPCETPCTPCQDASVAGFNSMFQYLNKSTNMLTYQVQFIKLKESSSIWIYHNSSIVILMFVEVVSVTFEEIWRTSQHIFLRNYGLVDAGGNLHGFSLLKVVDTCHLSTLHSASFRGFGWSVTTCYHDFVCI